MGGFVLKLIIWGAVVIALASGSARADALVYGVTGDNLFGVLDLNTGVFTESGDMGQRISGLGVGPGGVLYGSGYPYSSPNLYSINPTNGALTLVGNNFSSGFYDLGSTTTGLFAMGNSDGKLYSINPSTGAGSLIGQHCLEISCQRAPAHSMGPL